jgi:hypothetical protein
VNKKTHHIVEIHYRIFVSRSKLGMAVHSSLFSAGGLDMEYYMLLSLFPIVFSSKCQFLGKKSLVLVFAGSNLKHTKITRNASTGVNLTKLFP